MICSNQHFFSFLRLYAAVHEHNIFGENLVIGNLRTLHQDFAVKLFIIIMNEKKVILTGFMIGCDGADPHNRPF